MPQNDEYTTAPPKPKVQQMSSTIVLLESKNLVRVDTIGEGRININKLARMVGDWLLKQLCAQEKV